MKDKNRGMWPFNPVACARALLAFFAAVLMAPGAMALNLTVEGVNNCPPLQKTSDGCTTTGTPVTSYRWLVEEDKTYHVPLNPDGTVQIDDNGTSGDLTDDFPALDPNWRVGDPLRNTVSVSFHHSYMPVVMTGDETTLADLNSLDLSKNYFISILPNPDDTIGVYSIGGAPIKAGQTDVTVYVNKNPIPTAQITIFVHEDIAPINNVWDLGETGLEGFAIILEDAGGKYGASAGIQSQDAFGNLLCTTYSFVDTNGNGTHDPGELFVEDADGNPVIENPAPTDAVAGVPGSGCTTGPDGTVTIRNLAPGKYGILAVPPNAVEEPAGSGNFVSSIHTQTSTIEGKKLIDAWVKANEPAFFGEFGPPGPHVTIGFAPAGPNDPYIDATVLTGGATISGQVVNLHLSRPPDTAFYDGGPHPHTTPWVGLNLGAAGLGRGVYAARANDDGSFSIPNVPPGSYQLVVWDDNLDLLFAKSTVVVNADPATPDVANGSCNTLETCILGNIAVFEWFARMEHYVFNDENEDGIWQPDGADNIPGTLDDEKPLIEQGTNLRWRDGTIYQSFPTDAEGVAPYDEVFPFFSWLVAEVDFGRFKATGATIVVDDGGPVPFGDPWAFDDVLNPQPQGVPADPDSAVTTDKYRTELGPVLTQAFQAFLGQTNVVEWGKKAYNPADIDAPPLNDFPGVGDTDWNENGVLDAAENGGISGMVMYAVTRAEDDPEQAAAEPWEPGIPRVTVNLYDSTGTTLLATTETDSWDDSLPANCQYGVNNGSGTDDPFVFRDVDTDCYDGMRNWNQVRPGVFDGGYAFDTVCVGGLDPLGMCLGTEISPIPAGQYIAEVITPPGYEVIKSQDRNVDFGDTFFPSPELLPPPCANFADVDGDTFPGYTVPAELSLFPGEPAPFAGQQLPLCDRKQVTLAAGANAAADFFLFTQVPIAGHFIGFILDDTANEFDPTSPQFGEKYAPPFLPVSIRDWTGREISRTVSDEFGVYNALIPSTYTENLGQPSGISPNMLTTCMNAKSKPDGSGGFVDDPLHNPQYSQFCYTFQYMPGSTTYLDTPVVPVAAFAGPDQNPLDCEYVDTTPRIHSVSAPNNGFGGGPYLTTNNQGNITNGGIVIQSMGMVTVPNPAYGGVGSTALGTVDKTIERDYGFGCPTVPPTVTIGGVSVPVTCGTDSVTGAEILEGTAAGIPEGAQQLVVTRGDANGKSTITGVTVQVGLRSNQADVVVVDNGPTPPAGAYTKIQDAINAASANDLILVAPGVYDELVIMWKPVQLQGWGEGSTTIDAIKAPFNKLSDWRILAEDLVTSGAVTLVPGQEQGFGGIEPATFFSEEGAGVFVVANSGGNSRFGANNNKGARIDGFSISGADTGGGIVLNGFADFMDISNNRVVNNSAFFAGGVRVGHPLLTAQQGNNVVYSDADNDNVHIHHNTINQNGGLDGAGGGVALHTGSDSYQVTDNFVCGNFTTAAGAGIAHFGFSDKDGNNAPVPLIEGNTVIFNENFNQGTTVNGGGILVSGMPAFGCPIDPLTGVPDPACLLDPEQVLSPGSGSVIISSNLIKGNSAGVGDGAGIRLSRINGQDVSTQGGGQNPTVNVDWTIDVINNMIVDNMAALAGGGISLQDALDVDILHNTIANNDNASTSGDAFTAGVPSRSEAQPGAGIVSRAHSAELAQFAGAGFSDANLVDNIVWHNRKFFWLLDDTPIPAISGLCPDINGDVGLTCGLLTDNDPVYDDLAVIGAADTDTLTCNDCILTDDADPAFVAEYVNGSRNTTTVILEGTIQATPAFDEGGNFIRLRYGPLTETDTVTGLLLGDYHITTPSSSALNTGSDAGVTDDFDGEPRPVGLFDIGADEVQ